MTFKNFSKIFNASEVVTFAKLKNTSWAVDAFIEIFRLGGMQGKVQLINPQGEPTMHITAALANITKCIHYNIDNIWIFDSRHTRIEKVGEVKKRKDAVDKQRKTAESKLAELKKMADGIDPEELKELDSDYEEEVKRVEQKLKTLDIHKGFGGKIADIKFLLNCLGVKWIQIEDDMEAEQLGALMAIEGIVQGVRTTDPDALSFGSPVLLKKVPKKTGTYNKYVIADCLSQHDITYDQFIDIHVAMGTDFAPKYPRIGVKRVVNAVCTPNYLDKWTKSQEEAKKIFKERPEIDFDKLIQIPERTPESIVALVEWLTVVQGFDKNKVEKKLKLIS